eukprot:CAMPEP_0184862676 /NCGR_PEP_ID=MMETSP0580-20130426/7092_1 /TAXON_ID=1118495 /ORGANISM="Dactyliosolen fragilissimus" /LENGTH=1285 /DNA_ID=CAMNT_0027360631 /DNA_START=179 /DNA_END=4036 /DNA_ORIENTATION=+
MTSFDASAADRDAEIAVLQTAFDEYIASSRELEDELDAELAKMQEKLTESSAANKALVSQLESLHPQINSLEVALGSTKSKLEKESALRREAELRQDEAEARARETEGSLEALRAESDNLHELYAIQESELEDARMEIELNAEQFRQEIDELKRVGGGSSGSRRHKDAGGDDNMSAMSDDFANLTVTTTAGVADDDEDSEQQRNVVYIKQLEDELEDVTDQLIKTEKNMDEMGSKLEVAEKSKQNLSDKIVELNEHILELQTKENQNSTNVDQKNKFDNYEEELELANEELVLTQEELRAAEEDSKAAAEKLEKMKGLHNEEIKILQKELDEAKVNERSATLQIEALESAIKDANNETNTLREEVDNLIRALNNAKDDHNRVLLEMEGLKTAFDENKVEFNEHSNEKLASLEKECKLEVEILRAQMMEVFKKNGGKAEDLNDELGKVIESKFAKDQKETEKKVEFTPSFGFRNKFMFEVPHKSNLYLMEYFNLEDKNQSSHTSEFFRSHARSRSRFRHSSHSRGRSSSPTIIQHLETDLTQKTKEIKILANECRSLKKQKRLSEIRSTNLEGDLSNVKNLQLQALKEEQKAIESRDDNDVEDKDIEEILNTKDEKIIADELRALATKSSRQKEHNSQLLVKILKLQGNIQVCCRVRPLREDEVERGMKRVVEPLSESELGCFDQRTKEWKSFVFDRLWGPDSTQRSVFQDVEPLSLSVVDGYNACIFAYGQTGSGKTFTMEGSGKGQNVGISYRTIKKIFNLLHDKARKHELDIKLNELQTNGDTNEIPNRAFAFSIKVGMLEIYNDEVYDLLAPVSKGIGPSKKVSLDIRRGENGGIEVPGLIKEEVNSLDEVISLLNKGNLNRATASTNMNEHSSRSHMVLNVEVATGFEGEPLTTGNLYLVDLAGSERVRKSAVDGQALKEAGHINKSLAALGNVMEALDRKASFVPYRDSKLTYLLQDSLGGNSRTMMVVTVCPTADSFDESQHALQFATRVRRINLGSAKKNVSAKNLEETVKKLSSEMKLLAKAKEKTESQLHKLKRDHTRIQERLKSSQQSRKSSVDETRTLNALKVSNSEINSRWKKEKEMREQVSNDLEESQNELKRVQQDLMKVKREKESISTKFNELETIREKLTTDLRNAKSKASAATLKLRTAELKVQSRKSSSPGIPKAVQRPSSTNPSSLPPKAPYSLSPAKVTDIRAEVLKILEEHDSAQVHKIDMTMQRFKGKELELIPKLRNCYGLDSDTRSVSSSRKSVSSKERSEMAMAKHLDRIRKKKEAARKS